ncbi:Lcl domain-containing protein [Methylomarinum vadi]|uniref:Lcl domain-containing protein n=1 Tax=Methylomarinum vadi TaxID=438855 RepID=UPI000A006AA7|nr:DUF1566 domain-containing protein [Methylomarinum vadi]
MASRLLGAISACFFMSIAQSAQSAIAPLQIRLGGAAYYDPNLNITWAADSNINGLMDWNAANTWAANLTISGVSDWRLPSADVNGDGAVVDCNGGGVTGCADNEMGFLYWEEGITTINPGPFSDVRSGVYWIATESSSDLSRAWALGFNMGQLATNSKTGSNYAWAVHDGDVSAVPVPAAAWLFGTAMVGMLGVARRMR